MKTIKLVAFFLVLNLYSFGKLQFIAHRGASYYAPENSQAAIHLAWELGCDGAEIDIQLTVDNQIVVWHDTNTNCLTNQLDIANTSYSELKKLDIKLRASNSAYFEGQRMALLKEVLKTIPENQLLVIEIKCGNEIFPVLKKVISKNWKSGRIALIGFGFETISMAKSLFPEVPCYYLTESKEVLMKNLPEIKKNKLDGVDLHLKV